MEKISERVDCNRINIYFCEPSNFCELDRVAVSFAYVPTVPSTKTEDDRGLAFAAFCKRPSLHLWFVQFLKWDWGFLDCNGVVTWLCHSFFVGWFKAVLSSHRVTVKFVSDPRYGYWSYCLQFYWSMAICDLSFFRLTLSILRVQLF